ncbi:sugar ABC transporter ATP-binding protein [Ammoniphilus resinae]|uniref:ABC-type sugar transport system ATPase subunit n=1 Tax=Ammoniphilus resinae TaxID=861532 RepID=A0ABS4GW29_9BACL|nr:sugar ABC transporter ATP-binding protein [Ammoniphilus resinae]MBP1934302.1 ABC-type sugar transport system ATPase subunit [Ammoniphilus resinae]
MGETILQVKGITKTFPGVKALDQVSFDLKTGEVHALLGENGAGKSTLMQVLGGIYQPDAGELILQGKSVRFKHAYDATTRGISVVFQELSLVPNLSIAENIFANRQPTNRFNLIKKEKMYEEARKLLQLFDEDIHPGTLVKFLSPATQQVIEILKAISYNPKVLILDEPTSSLTTVEVEKLFANIRKLQQQGIAVIYISHHLNEIFEIANRVTVLRDGKYVGTEPIESLTEDKIIQMMVGRELTNMYGDRPSDAEIGEEIFTVQGLTRKGACYDISFSLKRGEILGIAGLVGAGRTELGRTIFGAEPADSGAIYLKGQKISIRSPKQAIQQGIGYLTENRKEQGLFLERTMKDNAIAPNLKRFTSRGLDFINEKMVDQTTERYREHFRVITPSIKQKVGRLSGGNQQKVLLSMWVGIEPKVLIVDEPTRGVDVGAKSEIYQHLRQLAKQGVGLIVISSDLPEVMGISDRILVMREGKMVAEFQKEQFTQERIIAAASGVLIS